MYKRQRVGTVESGRPYLYLRQGGVHFNAKEGLLYICMAGHLFVPEKLSLIHICELRIYGIALDFYDARAA